MKIRTSSARHAGVGSFSLKATQLCTSQPDFLDRPLPVSPLVAQIGREVSKLLDAHNEAENNVQRGETHFLEVNLTACFDLAKSIQAHRKEARRLLAKIKGGR